MKKSQDASEVKKCSARRDDRCGLSCACDLRSRCGLGTNGKNPGTGIASHEDSSIIYGVFELVDVGESRLFRQDSVVVCKGRSVNAGIEEVCGLDRGRLDSE